MGSEKSSQETTTTVEATPEEKEMQRLQLEQFKQTSGPQTDVQLAGLEHLQALFTGGDLSKHFQEASQGISPEAIGAQASEMTRQNMPGFESLGLGTSGVGFAQNSQDIANNLLYPAEQFNIGAKQNLLNLAFGGQAQVQQPMIAQQGMLANQLAGLRSTTGVTNTTQMNPFLKSFQQGAGNLFGFGEGFGQGLGTGIGSNLF